MTRARATSMEDRCTGSAPSRLAHGSAARGMLGADGADFAARRERAARQSTSRRANDRTTHTTSRHMEQRFTQHSLSRRPAFVEPDRVSSVPVAVQ